MGQTHDGEAAVMGGTETPSTYPATSDEMTNALNAALETGDLNRIIGTLGK